MENQSWCAASAWGNAIRLGRHRYRGTRVAAGVKATIEDAPTRTPRDRSAGDDEVDGLRAFAFLVGLDIERDALSFGQRLEPGTLDGGDVHEHIAPAVIRLDEAVATLGIEELDGTCHCHWGTPTPWSLAPPALTARRARPTFVFGDRHRPQTASVTPPAPNGG